MFAFVGSGSSIIRRDIRLEFSSMPRRVWTSDDPVTNPNCEYDARYGLRDLSSTLKGRQVVVVTGRHPA